MLDSCRSPEATCIGATTLLLFVFVLTAGWGSPRAIPSSKKDRHKAQVFRVQKTGDSDRKPDWFPQQNWFPDEDKGDNKPREEEETDFGNGHRDTEGLIEHDRDQLQQDEHHEAWKDGSRVNNEEAWKFDTRDHNEEALKFDTRVNNEQAWKDGPRANIEESPFDTNAGQEHDLYQTPKQLPKTHDHPKEYVKDEDSGDGEWWLEEEKQSNDLFQEKVQSPEHLR